jgi:hypothetical protein
VIACSARVALQDFCHPSSPSLVVPNNAHTTNHTARCGVADVAGNRTKDSGFAAAFVYVRVCRKVNVLQEGIAIRRRIWSAFQISANADRSHTLAL